MTARPSKKAKLPADSGTFKAPFDGIFQAPSKAAVNDDNDEDLETFTRKGGVKQDVYGSDDEVDDSDDSKAESDKDEDDEMFDEKEKKSKFMRNEEVEGQEEGDDEMMESFNMKKEFDEGDFTLSGVHLPC